MKRDAITSLHGIHADCARFPDDKFFENKRSRALKRLALRTLAFMKWDLDALEK